ncbi:MAG: hypothetical protein IJR99_14085 [Kiritimatiellae bacterium]|nr:hypothetical protein [Kiritimatiellia bacterium]
MTQDPTRLGVPTGWTFQQTVANLDVESNVAGIQTGKGIATGNIEFHYRNYGAPNAINIPNASGNNFDFGDRLDTGGNYGCMQVHNFGARQTIWAHNHFNAGNTVQIGIGNSALRSDVTDWTFSDNAGNYSHRRLCVFVSRAKIPQVLSMGVEAPRRAVVSLARDRVCVSYPAAVPKTLLAADRYAFADASIQIKDVARSASEPRDVLLTLAEPLAENTTNSLTVSLAPYTADKTLAVVAPPATLPAFLTRSNVSELRGYQLLNALEIKDSVCYSYPGADYLVDESRFNAGIRYDRVAYCMELQDTNHYQWVFAGMDTFCEDASKLGVPSVERQILHQCYVSNLTVYAGASDNDITVQTGSFPAGNIEFWPNNFAAGNDKGIPGADGSYYDFGDSMTATAPACGHGSMQVHNYLAQETILSMVAFGHSGNTAQFRTPGLGIGNNPNFTAKKDPDWTF